MRKFWDPPAKQKKLLWRIHFPLLNSVPFLVFCFFALYFVSLYLLATPDVWSADISKSHDSDFKHALPYQKPMQSYLNLASDNPCVNSTGGARLQMFMVNDRDNEDKVKMEFVKKMLLHAWNGYEKYAWGYDELMPLTQTAKNWYDEFSLLMTPVDSLDTLWIMGLKDEYNRAKKLVLDTLDFSKINIHVSVFEITIRILAGLLSAYDLEGDQRLLAKAVELADRLLPSFDTQTGIPLNWINLASGEFRSTDIASTVPSTFLSEAGTLQLEFQYLSDMTGNPIYAEKALFAMEQIMAMEHPIPGIYPITVQVDTLKFGNCNVVHVHSTIKLTIFQPSTAYYSIGSGGDSFYEYLLKLWLSTGEERYWDVYYESAQSVFENLAKVSQNFHDVVYLPNHQFYSGILNPEANFHHLTCFAGGMFATGALARREGNWTEHLQLARQITDTCYKSYNKTVTGLGPELIDVNADPYYNREYHLRQVEFDDFVFQILKFIYWGLVRPETAESIFYMWRYTHDPKYREMGWNIVQNLNKWCKMPAGFSGLSHVSQFMAGFDQQTGEPIFTPPITNFEQHNRQYSYNLLKSTPEYPYVDAVSHDVVPLEKYVFNTEAHPLSVRGYGRRSNPADWSYVPVPKKVLKKYEVGGGKVKPFEMIGFEVGTTRQFSSAEVRKRKKIVDEMTNQALNNPLQNVYRANGNQQ
ncbi:Mannosyl-oligosaccharide 1,2-alpha-mannosidase IB [Nowakowskiella sp. JEL0407]|nr:Mannosyl-oligosaccharide 1,2-alpha-mannosidase IB [Nowakowskiella sp. JEL0407]